MKDLQDPENQIKDAEEEFFFVELSQNEYRPGEDVQGNVEWKFSEPAESIEVRLLIEISENSVTKKVYAAGLRWNHLPSEGICNFSLQLPEAPYSFIGKRIRINWYVEAQCPAWEYSDEVGFSFSPTGTALELKSK